jgi:hypothetical protein
MGPSNSFPQQWAQKGLMRPIFEGAAWAFSKAPTGEEARKAFVAGERASASCGRRWSRQHNATRSEDR